MNALREKIVVTRRYTFFLFNLWKKKKEHIIVSKGQYGRLSDTICKTVYIMGIPSPYRKATFFIFNM